MNKYFGYACILMEYYVDRFLRIKKVRLIYEQYNETYNYYDSMIL